MQHGATHREHLRLPVLSRVFDRIKHDHLLQVMLLLGLALAVLDPRSPHDYLRWLALPTLAGLTGLLILAEGVRVSGHVQRFAVHLLAHLHDARTLAYVLTLMSALLASVLTNDVALFLIVPLTLAIDRLARIPRQRLVIFEERGQHVQPDRQSAEPVPVATLAAHILRLRREAGADRRGAVDGIAGGLPLRVPGDAAAGQ
jgi:di/tricarboxylate transporter